MDPEGPPPGPAGGDISDEASEQATLGDAAWPVDERYLVEPDERAVEDGFERIRADESGEVAAVPAGETGARAAALGAAVLLLALLLAAALGAWLVLRPAHSGTSSPSAARPPSGSPPGGSAAATSTSTTTGASRTSTTSPTSTTPTATLHRTRPVPDATGLALADARSRLSASGFRVHVRTHSSSAPPHQVLQETPEPGSTLRPGAAVVLTVSDGPARVTLPSLVGLRADAAAKKTRGLGLVPVLRVVRSTRPAGTVLGQDPAAGAHAARGRSVRLEVAKNVPKPVPAVPRVRVPELGGLSASAARSRLAAARLTASLVQVASSRPQGVVVDQSPSPGTRVRKGATVRISVSSGPKQVAVPSVVGLDEQSAREQLQAAGFEVRVVTESTTDPTEDGTVTAQDPQGGTKADVGSTVTITVAQLGQP